MYSQESEMGETIVEHADRISTLPDAILIRILSCLLTKNSVRTSALSTRWKNLYASVPVLQFNLHNPDPIFTAFVYQIFKTVTAKLPGISKFSIRLNTPSQTSDIISWIDTAISNRVQELEVLVVLSEITPTPHHIFTCKTLVSLRLDLTFVLSVPDSVSLPNLKELHLGHIVLRDESDDDLVWRLFSSCPVLEELTVTSFIMDKARVFNVSVPSLKRLGVYLHDVRNEYELLINCPNLKNLCCTAHAKGGYSGDILRSLEESFIHIELHDDDRHKEGKLMELVNQVCKVQRLSLIWNSMEALLNPPRSLPIFENLTRLELYSCNSEGWRLLPSLLQSSPRLKTLGFPFGMYDPNHYVLPFSPPEQVPVCLSYHLKLVRIKRFYGDENEYKLVEYFLANALVLEKMVIWPWSHGDSEREGEEEGEPESDLERHFGITRRLLTFRRYSKVCQIVFLSSHDEEY